MAKNVLITGVNKGIGFETARRPGGYGDLDKAHVVSEIAERLCCGLAPFAVPGAKPDPVAVNDDASVRDAAERVNEVDGKLDLLIDNVGIPGNYIDPVPGCRRHPPYLRDQRVWSDRRDLRLPPAAQGCR